MPVQTLLIFFLYLNYYYCDKTTTLCIARDFTCFNKYTVNKKTTVCVRNENI